MAASSFLDGGNLGKLAGSYMGARITLTWFVSYEVVLDAPDVRAVDVVLLPDMEDDEESLLSSVGTSNDRREGSGGGIRDTASETVDSLNS